MVGKGAGSADLGPKVFFIWGSFCILSLVFAYFLVPEMKGLTLEQIDKMMEETSPRESASWKPTTTFAAEMGHVRTPYFAAPVGGGGYQVEASYSPPPPPAMQGGYGGIYQGEGLGGYAGSPDYGYGK